jgi:hypothetical protein
MQFFLMKLSLFPVEKVHVISEICVVCVGQDSGKCEISQTASMPSICE